MIRKIWALVFAMAIVLIPQLANASVPNDIPSVHIIAGSDINLLASDARIPVRVKNTTKQKDRAYRANASAPKIL